MKEITLFMPKKFRCNRIHCSKRDQKGVTSITEAIVLRDLSRKMAYHKRDLSRLIGRNDTYVSRRICLLSLPPEVRNLIDSGKLSSSHGEVLHQSLDRNERRIEFARKSVSKKWSACDLEEIIRQEKSSKWELTSTDRLDAEDNQTEEKYLVANLSEGICMKKSRICTDESCSKRSRQRLTIIEEAIALQSAMRSLNLNCEELSRKIGKYKGYVADRVRLLGLPKTVRDMIDRGVLSYRHGAALQKMLVSQEEKIKFARLTLLCEWSVHKLERVIKEHNLKDAVEIMSSQSREEVAS